MNVRAILELDAARRVKENVLHAKHSLEAAGKSSERALVALAAQVIERFQHLEADLDEEIFLQSRLFGLVGAVKVE